MWRALLETCLASSVCAIHDVSHRRCVDWSSGIMWIRRISIFKMFCFTPKPYLHTYGVTHHVLCLSGDHVWEELCLLIHGYLISPLTGWGNAYGYKCFSTIKDENPYIIMIQFWTSSASGGGLVLRHTQYASGFYAVCRTAIIFELLCSLFVTLPRQTK